MCQECNKFICASSSQCPNAAPPAVVYNCASCGADIVDGEECYYNYHTQAHYCGECISVEIAEWEDR